MTTGSSTYGGKNKSRSGHGPWRKSNFMDQPENKNSLYIFMPSPRLKLLYLTYLFFVVWVFIMPSLMIISIEFPPSFSLPVSIAAFVIVLLTLAWIRLYHRSIRYHFTDGQIIKYNGVLFKKTTSLPCDQIHRVSTRRGPFQRLFGFSTIDLLRNDPGASSGSRILLSVTGVANPGDLEKRIDSCRMDKITV